MKIILLDNSYARLRTTDDEEYEWVKDYLSIFDHNAKFTVSYKRGHWDGNVHYLMDDGRFLLGLLPRLFYDLNSIGIKPKLVDQRNLQPYVENPIIPKVVGEFELRDYQQKIAANVLSYKIMGTCPVPFPRGIVYAATNAGKSLMAAAMIKALKGIRTLFLCPGNEILNQIHEEFLEFFPKVGLYLPKKDDVQDLTVGLITTLAARIKSKEVKQILNSFDCVIIDEAHRATASTWAIPIIQSNALYKIALSGTALKADMVRNVKLVGMTGIVLGEISNKELVDKGYSAKPEINMCGYEQRDIVTYDERAYELDEVVKELSVQKRALDVAGAINLKLDNKLREFRRQLYSISHEVGITHNKNRNQVINKLVKKHDGESILIVVSKIPHGQLLKEKIKGSTFVSADKELGHDKKYREQVLKDFKSGKIKVLIATMIYKEGISIPSIDILIFAIGEKAPITLLQFFGRGLRISKTKDTVMVYDFLDESTKKLKQHTDNRIQIYESEGFTVNKINFL